VKEAPPKPWPLYNRTRVAASDTIVVVEGEKCVHALADIGIVATTAPGGAGKAPHADWTPLAEKTVYLWPDADPVNPPKHPHAGKRTGIEHMKDVAQQLQALEPPPLVLWLDVDQLGLPPKGDVVEYLDTYGGDTAETKRNAITCALQLAEPMGASAGAASAHRGHYQRQAEGAPMAVARAGTADQGAHPRPGDGAGGG
jgi:hypothetical protein